MTSSTKPALERIFDNRNRERPAEVGGGANKGARVFAGTRKRCEIMRCIIHIRELYPKYQGNLDRYLLIHVIFALGFKYICRCDAEGVWSTYGLASPPPRPSSSTTQFPAHPTPFNQC